MRFPFTSSKRNKPAEQRLEWVRSLFAKFQRIQKYNTKSLETMAEMDRALGGEYIFDRAFLESSVRELSRLVYQVVYSLNAMSGNGHVALFDRYQSIKGVLDDILAGGMGPLGAGLVLPYSALGIEMESLAGGLNACLAEARNRLDIPAPDGFAVTIAGCSQFLRLLESNRAGMPADGMTTGALKEPRGQPDLPSELAEDISYQVQALFERRGGPVPLTVRISSAGAGHDPMTGIDSKNVLRACSLALIKYHELTGEDEKPPVALAVHESVQAYLAGSVSIMTSQGAPYGLFCITAWPVKAPNFKERYFVRRTYPFDPVASEIKEKAPAQPLYGSVLPLSYTPKGMHRGSALIDPPFLRSIAECAVAFERIAGCPQDLEWVRTDSERPVILNVSPAGANEMSAETDTGGQETEDGTGSVFSFLGHPSAVTRSANTEVLMTGGETVQTGIAAGPVVHVRENELDRFPHGAVAVVRHAHPSLSAILRRASAIVTEIGTSIGHLATIARELRVPAIFGADGAIGRLPEGTEVTVDAGDKTVYRGVAEWLLASRADSGELYPTEPEYVMLRRLLRWIMPLDLVDPESSSFSIENCRTYHDIIHFAHERSIEELLKIQDHGPGLKSRYVRKLKADTPIDLFVLDIGSGVSPGASASVRIDDIISKPFIAFLKGLTLKEVWDRAPGSLSIREIVSGLDRTFTAMTESPEYAGRNHAILAENYMNVGLRLGYHYSVIDSYLSGNINQNYVYFRFAGGFADENHRRRRAEFIRAILDQLSFKVAVKGDLVLGKLKLVDNQEISSALTVLGELTGFTRQIDLQMDSEDKIQIFIRMFQEKSRLDMEARGCGEDA